MSSFLADSTSSLKTESVMFLLRDFILVNALRREVLEQIKFAYYSMLGSSLVRVLNKLMIITLTSDISDFTLINTSF